MPKLSTLLDQIDLGTVLLPEFQRGYVWNREQVRGLMQSLYLGYPVGGLLMWETSADGLAVRGGEARGTHLLLLDGQQRMTSLYGVVRGKPPAFFEGDASSFTGLYFHMEKETFEFYRAATMAGDSRWVNVTELFNSGPMEYYNVLHEFPDRTKTYLQRLNRLVEVQGRQFNQEEITGADKTVDEVVDIFNRVNSGGTKLSKGDLALAKLCAEWPQARQVMRDALARWGRANYTFGLDWLLRNVTAVATGRAIFTYLDKLSADEFRGALTNTVNHVGTTLDAISGRLGLDHNQVLMGRSAIPAISRLLELNGGRFTDSAQRDKVLYWYVHAALRGRYAGSTETVLQKDVDVIAAGGVDGLIEELRRWRGSELEVRSEDFQGATRGSRFYPLLYLLTRVSGARDFGSGLELKAELLGKLSSLQLHHVFPKALLRDDYEHNQVNAIANFCFLTQDTNLQISNRRPAEYLAEVESKHPGVLASQWIPTDPALWELDRYEDFLEARRELLAQAAQSFLEGLLTGHASQTQQDLAPVTVVTDNRGDARVAQIQGLIDALREMGYATPLTDTEIADPVSGRELAMAEAFWPDGLQTGVGDPIVLELDPEEADLPRLEELGYSVFTSVDALLGYAKRRNAQAAGSAAEPDPEELPTAPAPQVATDTVGREFAKRMRDIYERARTEVGYNATQFLGMLSELGPVATASRLLNSPTVSDGFASLWERGRLDLTVEAVVVEPQFAELFTGDEIAAAEFRLKQFGYAVPVGVGEG